MGNNLSLFIVLLNVVFASCSNHEVRSKFSDKSLRVMLYPRGISEDHYSKIQSALVQTDAFTVVDRGIGLQALKEEQQATHRTESDRYDDQQKFSHWGKLYGVGSVIVAHVKCNNRPNPWRQSELRNYCDLVLNIIDSNTGVIVTSIDAKDDSPFGLVPDWKDAAWKLVDEYPKYFTPEKITERLELYKKESEKHAIEQKKI